MLPSILKSLCWHTKSTFSHLYFYSGTVLVVPNVHIKALLLTHMFLLALINLNRILTQSILALMAILQALMRSFRHLQHHIRPSVPHATYNSSGVP